MSAANYNNKQRTGYLILSIFFLAAVFFLWKNGPIPQAENYHSFSDETQALGIQNFWNVLSNLPFILVAFYGLRSYIKYRVKYKAYLTFLIGILLIGFGSAYYHYMPDSQSLIWDRIPMTIVFMSILAISLDDLVKKDLSRYLLLPFILLGFLSIYLWVAWDDLRLYAFLQFFPIVLLLVLLAFNQSRRIGKKAYGLLLIFYGVAKICEHFDEDIHEAFMVISGHSLKHFFAALALFYFTQALFKDQKNVTLDQT